MKRIGIVSCEKWKNLIKEDLLLQSLLNESGLLADIISWEDDSLDYSKYHCLILRSVWGYQNKYIEFEKWLQSLKENNIKIFNDVDMILNNVKKDIQFQILDAHHISHIPTIFIKNQDEMAVLEKMEGCIVVKPIISGSGENVNMIDLNIGDKKKYYELFKNSLLNILSYQKRGLMIQPFIPDVINGEYSCIFINGINTHNMIKFPGIFTPKQETRYLDFIPKIVEQLAHDVSIIREYKGALYMRVDIVCCDEKPYVMEVELAEPDLLTKYIDELDIQEHVLKTLVKSLERRI